MRNLLFIQIYKVISPFVYNYISWANFALIINSYSNKENEHLFSFNLYGIHFVSRHFDYVFFKYLTCCGCIPVCQFNQWGYICNTRIWKHSMYFHGLQRIVAQNGHNDLLLVLFHLHERWYKNIAFFSYSSRFLIIITRYVIRQTQINTSFHYNCQLHQDGDVV